MPGTLGSLYSGTLPTRPCTHRYATAAYIYRPMGMVSVIAGVAVFRQIVRGRTRMTTMRTGDVMATAYDVTRTCHDQIT